MADINSKGEEPDPELTIPREEIETDWPEPPEPKQPDPRYVLIEHSPVSADEPD